MIELSEAKRRLIERLKRVDTATAGELAVDLDLTDAAVRQHLEALLEAGFVRRNGGNAQGRGRPASRWQVTELADGVFPDRHGELTVDLIESIRTALGDEALRRVIVERARRQLHSYRSLLDDADADADDADDPDDASDDADLDAEDHAVAVRVRRLAEQRCAEGYVAEVEADAEGLVLVEHHCPVRSAAGACGDGVEVTRLQHLLAGDHRCAYRIRRRAA